MSETSILQLQKAEDQAASIIRAAREYRNQRLKQAKLDAQTEINQYRDKKERKYQQAEAMASGPDAVKDSNLQRQTLQEIEAMQADYAKNKDKVIQLLLEAVTCVKIDVADNLKLDNDA